jgi:hypothetical protein
LGFQIIFMGEALQVSEWYHLGWRKTKKAEFPLPFIPTSCRYYLAAGAASAAAAAFLALCFLAWCFLAAGAAAAGAAAAAVGAAAGAASAATAEKETAANAAAINTDNSLLIVNSKYS